MGNVYSSKISRCVKYFSKSCSLTTPGQLSRCTSRILQVSHALSATFAIKIKPDIKKDSVIVIVNAQNRPTTDPSLPDPLNYGNKKARPERISLVLHEDSFLPASYNNTSHNLKISYRNPYYRVNHWKYPSSSQIRAFNESFRAQ